MQKKAFTLIELLVIIAIVGIIAFSISNINFKQLTDRQKLDGFFYKIKTNIETIQNNAIIGRAIKDGTKLVVPKTWKIDFNNSNSGIILASYSLNGTNFKEFNKIIPEKFYKIQIKNNNSLLHNTGSILFSGINMTLTGITSNDKNLEIIIKYKTFEKKIKINTISGVIDEE